MTLKARIVLLAIVAAGLVGGYVLAETTDRHTSVIVDVQHSESGSPAPSVEPSLPGLVAPTADEPSSAPAVIYYGSCADARKAGAAPIRRGQPGYRSALDRDGDGVACDG